MQVRVVDPGPIAVQGVAAPVEAEASLELVAARLGDQGDEPALATAVIRAGPGGLDLDLIDRLDVDLLTPLPGQRIVGRDTIHERDDVGIARSVDRRIAVAVHVRHAGGQRQDILVVASEDRQGIDELGIEDGRCDGRLGVDDVPLGGGGDLLLHLGAGTQRDRDGEDPSGGDVHVHFDRRHLGELDLEDVTLAGRQRGDAELAARVRDDRLVHTKAFVLEENAGRGQGLAVLVDDFSFQARGRLGEDREVEGQDQTASEKEQSSGDHCDEPPGGACRSPPSPCVHRPVISPFAVSDSREV